MIFIPLISFLLTVSALDYSNPKGWADSSYAKMMAKYKHDLNIQIRESAKMEYEAQFQANPPLQEDQIESPAVKIEKYQQTAANILSKVGPVLNQSLYEIAYNPNGEYYEWNESANGWVLPSDPSTALSVNGSALNAQTLSQKYQNALKTALSDYAIQKRGLASELAESLSKASKSALKSFDDAAPPIPKEIEIKAPPAPEEKISTWQWLKNGLSYQALKRDLATYFKSKAMRYIYFGSAALLVSLITYDVFFKKRNQTSNEGASNSNQNNLASGDIYDEKTGITYYLDQESGNYYYFDKKTNSYQWY